MRLRPKGRELILGGDGLCDSPGHSAKYGSYSLMDLEKNNILDSQLVQVCIFIKLPVYEVANLILLIRFSLTRFQSNEVKNSAAMEKEGLERSLKYLTEEGLSVNSLITDRHVQIRKYMRERWPAVKHRFDGWHIGKGELIYNAKKS